MESMTKDEQQMLQQVLSSAKEVFAFRSSLNQETDRGCALMAAAYLDTELEWLLKGILWLIQKWSTTYSNIRAPLGLFPHALI
jgi:hypothetical protein